MRRAFPFAAFLALAFQASGEWYAIDRTKGTGTEKIEDGHLVVRVPIRVLDLKVVAVILRETNDYLGKYVIEATLDKQRDSGNGYYLAFGQTVIHDIKTRGDKWAMGFDSLELARECLNYLQKHHKLDPSHVRDTTKTRAQF